MYVHGTGVMLSLLAATISVRVRHFDHKGLRQLQNSFVTDEDLRSQTSSSHWQLLLRVTSTSPQAHSTKNIPRQSLENILRKLLGTGFGTRRTASGWSSTLTSHFMLQCHIIPIELCTQWSVWQMKCWIEAKSDLLACSILQQQPFY